LNEGHTRKLERGRVAEGLFLVRYRATLVVVEGQGVGGEYALDAPSCTIGRGPGVDITLADDAMSRQHAALEVGRDGFRVRDMGSTNGISVNGHPVTAADLKHGDRIQLGQHTLQYVVEERERVGTYDLSDEV
jgi:pSer/pThr/pTyr-binding forkhead associated (FHA) protein